MALRWKSDVCGCSSTYQVEDGIATGELINPCEFHTTFEDTLTDNKLKNSSINTIQDLIDMTDKEIAHSFNYTTGEITLTLFGFTETDLENVYSLGLSVQIVEG